MITSTRRRVSGATSGRPLITLDTVGTETPASRASSAIVGRSGERRRARVATMARSIRTKVSGVLRISLRLRLGVDGEPNRQLQCAPKLGGTWTETFV